MKLSSVFTLASTLVVCTNAFSVSPISSTRAPTRAFMFTGAGEGMPSEDNPEEMEKMEQAAKSMGMSVEEYKLGVSARIRLTKKMSDARITGGSPGKVEVERDAHNPPQLLKITVTEDGKGLGKDAVGKELVAALKSTAETAKAQRAEAQKDMMAFVAEEMKKLK